MNLAPHWLARRSRRSALSLVVVGAFVAGTMIGPGAVSAAANTVQQVFVTNLPATQAVSGSVSVTNLPATQAVTGSVSVTNQPTHITIDNPAASAVPVREQGTPNVNVTNLPLDAGTVKVSGSVYIANNSGASVPVAIQGTPTVNVPAAAAVSADGAGGRQMGATNPATVFSTPGAIAQALDIHLGAGVDAVSFQSGSNTVAYFYGPDQGGSADIVVSLPREIAFDSISCLGIGTNCVVSWVQGS